MGTRERTRAAAAVTTRRSRGLGTPELRRGTVIAARQIPQHERRRWLWRRGLALSLATGVIVLGSAAVATPDGTPPASVSVAVSPTTLHYPDRRAFTLTITITTIEAQDVVINELSPEWPDRNTAGRVLRLQTPTLQGPGHLGTAQLIADFPINTCFRGPTAGIAGFDVALDAHTTTTVRQTMVAIHRPPWPRADYTPRLSQGAQAPTPIAVPHITMAGKQGVHVQLHANPPLGGSRRRLPRTARAGRDLSIAGRTSPVLVHAQLLVQARPYTRGTKRITTGEVRTDERGRFRTLPWRPGPGDYLVVASYHRPRHGLLPDRSCGLSFDVS